MRRGRCPHLPSPDEDVWAYVAVKGRRRCLYATVLILVPDPQTKPEPLYCPQCSEEVTDPLTCGDCGAVICRRCGTPLESPDELGMG